MGYFPRKLIWPIRKSSNTFYVSFSTIANDNIQYALRRILQDLCPERELLWPTPHIHLPYVQVRGSGSVGSESFPPDMVIVRDNTIISP